MQVSSCACNLSAGGDEKQGCDFNSKDLEEGGEELGPGVPGGLSSSQCILKTKRFYCD